MLIDYSSLKQNLISSKKIDFINKLNLFFPKGFKPNTCSFYDLSLIIEDAEQLSCVLLNLEERNTLFSNEGIVRLMLNWEKKYTELFIRYGTELKLHNLEDKLCISIDDVNDIRQALKKSKEDYALLHVKFFFNRLSLFKTFDEVEDTYIKAKNIRIFNSLRVDALNMIVKALYS